MTEDTAAGVMLKDIIAESVFSFVSVPRITCARSHVTITVVTVLVQLYISNNVIMAQRTMHVHSDAVRCRNLA